jgi:hypothetical protein
LALGLVFVLLVMLWRSLRRSLVRHVKAGAVIGTPYEADEVLAGDPGGRLQLPGVTSGSSTPVCAASIHAATTARVASWSCSSLSGLPGKATVATYQGLDRVALGERSSAAVR